MNVAGAFARPILDRAAPTGRLSALLAVSIAVSSLGLVSAPAALGLSWPVNTFSSASEQQLYQLTNQARASAGLRSLRWDSTLASIARWRSKDMIVRNYFSHSIPPSGESVFDVMSQKGYCFHLAGENIGWNNWPDDAATAGIQQSFMGSPGHRANIMGTTWNVMAVGAYKGADGKKMWTVLFANRCGSTTSTRATPRPIPRPTPRPVQRATPKPTPRPTPTARPTPTPTPTPTATPTPSSTPPDVPGPSRSTGRQPIVGPAPGQAASLRVTDAPASQGLVEAIVGDVTGFFFGS